MCACTPNIWSEVFIQKNARMQARNLFFHQLPTCTIECIYNYLALKQKVHYLNANKREDRRWHDFKNSTLDFFVGTDFIIHTFLPLPSLKLATGLCDCNIHISTSYIHMHYIEVLPKWAVTNWKQSKPHSEIILASYFMLQKNRVGRIFLLQKVFTLQF